MMAFAFIPETKGGTLEQLEEQLIVADEKGWHDPVLDPHHVLVDGGELSQKLLRRPSVFAGNGYFWTLDP